MKRADIFRQIREIEGTLCNTTTPTGKNAWPSGKQQVSNGST